MRIRLSGALRWGRALGTPAVAVLLAIYIGFLLIANYRSQIELQKTALQGLVQDKHKRATALSYFFAERKNDLKNLAESREMLAFSENRALGMSMEYGLRASLLAISERFSDLIGEKKIGEDMIYCRLVFVDSSGELLVDSMLRDVCRSPKGGWKRFVTPESPNPTVTTEDSMMLVSIPYFFKDEFAGQIIASITSQPVYDHLVATGGALKGFACIASGPEAIYPPDGLVSEYGASALTELQKAESGKPVRFKVITRDRAHVDIVALQAPVEGTPFSLIYALPASEVLGRASPRHLIMLMGTLAVVIFSAVVIFLRINMRNMVLQARFDEASKAKQQLEEKNRQLQEEAVRRQRAEDALQEANDSLEVRIGQRTAELKAANEQLQSEIRERSRAEKALRAEREQLLSIFNSINQIVYLADPKTYEILYVNSALKEAFRKDPTGGLCFKEFQGLDSPCEYCTNETILKGKGEPYQWEYHNPILNRDFMIIDRIIKWSDERDARFEIAIDITGRKRAEETLKDSERRLADIINFLPDATLVIDRKGKVIAWNRALEELTGVAAEVMLGKGGYEYALPFYEMRRPILVDLALQPDEKIENLYPYIEKDNDTLICEIFLPSLNGGVHLWGKARPLYDSQGNVVGAIETIRDITERKRAEETARVSEEKMRLIIESSPIGIKIIQNSAYVYANRACVRMFGHDGVDEILALSVEALYAPEQRDMIGRRQRDRLADKQVPSSFEATGLKKNGERFDVAIWVTVIDYQGEPALLNFVIDTSSEKSLRAQLLHAQKMEAVGTLAGGVAHDFNNLLQAIQGFAELLLLRKQENEPDYRELQKIAHAADRGASLTRQLLTFSRKVESKRRRIDLNHEVKQVSSLLERTIPKMIQVELELSDHLGIVYADPVQVEQVLMNLAVNAKDAMPEGGKLTIGTQNLSLNKEFCSSHIGAKPGDYVLLTVSDTGCGMNKETIEHIFEPFYTTKDRGSGTGLGLATVYGIVKSHDGYIICCSEVGEGTTFRIYLPVTDRLTEAPASEEAEVSLKGGTETILLVDDDEAIRTIGQQMLRRFGYVVLTAAEGETALDIYAKYRDQIHLVMLDLIMPGMGGMRCLDGLLSINPQARVVIASGHTPDGPMRSAIEGRVRGFIGKPYRVKEMLKVIREVLDED